jgi:hypothetical protein
LYNCLLDSSFAPHRRDRLITSWKRPSESEAPRLFRRRGALTLDRPRGWGQIATRLSARVSRDAYPLRRSRRRRHSRRRRPHIRPHARTRTRVLSPLPRTPGRRPTRDFGELGNRHGPRLARRELALRRVRGTLGAGVATPPRCPEGGRTPRGPTPRAPGPVSSRGATTDADSPISLGYFRGSWASRRFTATDIHCHSPSRFSAHQLLLLIAHKYGKKTHNRWEIVGHVLPDFSPS